VDALRPRTRAPFAAVTAVTLAVLGAALAGSGLWGSTPANAQEPAAARVVLAGSVSTAVRITPVQAGVVPDHLNAGLLAARAQAERDEAFRATLEAALADGAQRAEPALATDDERPGADTTGPGSDDDQPATTDSAAEPDVRALAAAALAALPGGDAVEIAWNHPDIGNHLGGVRLDKPTVMMLNSHRFEAQPERIEATVKHEIGHYYQGAVIAAHAESAGSWWNAYWQLDAALSPVFGSKWMERSADCVALHLGADWTHYTSDCSGDAAQAAVEALIANRMP